MNLKVYLSYCSIKIPNQHFHKNQAKTSTTLEIWGGGHPGQSGMILNNNVFLLTTTTTTTPHHKMDSTVEKYKSMPATKPSCPQTKDNTGKNYRYFGLTEETFKQ